MVSTASPPVPVQRGMGVGRAGAMQWRVSLPLPPAVFFGLKYLCADYLIEAPFVFLCKHFIKWRFYIITKSQLFLKTWRSVLTVYPKQLSHSHQRFQSPLHVF